MRFQPPYILLWARLAQETPILFKRHDRFATKILTLIMCSSERLGDFINYYNSKSDGVLLRKVTVVLVVIDTNFTKSFQANTL